MVRHPDEIKVNVRQKSDLKSRHRLWQIKKRIIMVIIMVYYGNERWPQVTFQLLVMTLETQNLENIQKGDQEWIRYWYLGMKLRRLCDRKSKISWASILEIPFLSGTCPLQSFNVIHCISYTLRRFEFKVCHYENHKSLR